MILLFYSYVCFIQYNYYLKECFIKGNILIYGIFYLSILGMINCISTFNLFIQFNLSNCLIFIGTILFWISVFILVRIMFYEILFYYHLIVMSCYISAQTFIAIGMSFVEKDFI
jgi:hypothetical protein